MRTQHTPGEWLTATDGVRTLVSVQGEGVIAVVNQGLPHHSANALLIAAAPELLSALQNALNVMAGVATGDLKTLSKDSPAIAQARLAIAKATSHN